LQAQVCAQRGQSSSQPQAPRLFRFPLLERLLTGRREIGLHVDGCAKLPTERIHLHSRVGRQRCRKLRLTRLRTTQLFGESLQLFRESAAVLIGCPASSDVPMEGVIVS